MAQQSRRNKAARERLSHVRPGTKQPGRVQLYPKLLFSLFLFFIDYYLNSVVAAPNVVDLIYNTLFFFFPFSWVSPRRSDDGELIREKGRPMT